MASATLRSTGTRLRSDNVRDSSAHGRMIVERFAPTSIGRSELGFEYVQRLRRGLSFVVFPIVHGGHIPAFAACRR